MISLLPDSFAEGGGPYGADLSDFELSAISPTIELLWLFWTNAVDSCARMFGSTHRLIGLEDPFEFSGPAQITRVLQSLRDGYALRIALVKLRKQVWKTMSEADIMGCRSPKEVRKAAQRGCDALITEADFWLRKDEGLVLAKGIMELCSRINTIFATAGVEREYAAQILRMRINGSLTKSFISEELNEGLKDLRYPKGVQNAV